VLDAKEVTISTSIDARKEKILAEQSWEMLQDSSEVVIAKGKKILKFLPTQAEKETILSAALGRSGTLRAPTFKIGTTFLIGFNQDLYDGHF
jgi:hypothetical protein